VPCTIFYRAAAVQLCKVRRASSRTTVRIARVYLPAARSSDAEPRRPLVAGVAEIRDQQHDTDHHRDREILLHR
jgi:hypothetical protein